MKRASAFIRFTSSSVTSCAGFGLTLSRKYTPTVYVLATLPNSLVPTHYLGSSFPSAFRLQSNQTAPSLWKEPYRRKADPIQDVSHTPNMGQVYCYRHQPTNLRFLSCR